MEPVEGDLPYVGLIIDIFKVKKVSLVWFGLVWFGLVWVCLILVLVLVYVGLYQNTSH